VPTEQVGRANLEEHSQYRLSMLNQELEDHLLRLEINMDMVMPAVG
jgi:hypothetical protein